MSFYSAISLLNSELNTAVPSRESRHRASFCGNCWACRRESARDEIQETDAFLQCVLQMGSHLLNAEPDQGSRKSHFHEVLELLPREEKRKKHEKEDLDTCAMYAFLLSYECCLRYSSTNIKQYKN